MATAKSIPSCRRRCRTLIVWAMVPLAAFNSRAVVGCGCSGRFEATCACECCKSQQQLEQNHRQRGGPCCSTVADGSCPHCCKAPGLDSRHKHARADETRGIRPHQCTPIAMRIADPMTSSSITAPECNVAAIAALTEDTLLVCAAERIRPILSWDIGPSPPPNLVGVLQRLVI